MWLVAIVNLCSIIMKPEAFNKDVSLMQYSRMLLSRLRVAVTKPISSVLLFAQFVQRRQNCLLMEYQVQNINVMQRI